MDIKATLECYDAIDAACEAVHLAAADKKLTILDARFLLAPLKAAVIAARDRSLLVSEVKDIDQAEFAVLVDRTASTTEKIAQLVEDLSTLVA